MNWMRQKWWDIASEIGEQKVDFRVAPTLSLANEASCHAGAALWRDSCGREPREAFGQQSVKHWSPRSNNYEWPNPANNFLSEPGKGPSPKPSLNSKKIWAPANTLIAVLERCGDRGINKLHLFWFLTHRKCYFKPLSLGVTCSRQEVLTQQCIICMVSWPQSHLHFSESRRELYVPCSLPLSAHASARGRMKAESIQT